MKPAYKQATHTLKGWPSADMVDPALTCAIVEPEEPTRKYGVMPRQDWLDALHKSMLLRKDKAFTKAYYANTEGQFFPEPEPTMAASGYVAWLDMVTSNPARSVVPITFMYGYDTLLYMSLQSVASGNYYDFSTKMFKEKPATPRAGLTRVDNLGKHSFIYGAVFGGSAKLHGQYVATIRDMRRSCGIVALLAYDIDNNKLAAGGEVMDLTQYVAEQGLPPAGFTSTKSGRAVELD